MTTTTDRPRGDGADDAVRARLEALGQRRAHRQAAPADRPGRRHPAARSRVAATAFSVAAMFGLVGVMGLVRPATSTPPQPPGDVALGSGWPLIPGEPATGPVALSARPRVQLTTLTDTPTARTNGSH